MTYRIVCPACATRVPRWQCFLTPALDYRCRKCGAKFRISPFGWLISAMVVIIQVVWFVLAIRHIIAPLLALALVVLTCILTIWLLPYLIPVNRSGPLTPGS